MRRGLALVTGASGGFGVHACAALVARGFRVIACMRDPGRAAAVREAIAARGFDADDPTHLEIAALDVDDPTATAALVDRVLDAHGAVDVLVNNAGIMVEGFAEELDEAELRRQFETNFFAAVRLTRALIGPMRARRCGRVINVSSMGGRHAAPGFSGYHASKFALEGWSEALRYELLPFGVFVALIEPGAYPTAIFGAKLRRIPAGAEYRTLAANLREAQARLLELTAGDPRDVGEAIAAVAIAPRPRLRHPIGIDAWLGAALGARSMTGIWERTVERWARR